MTPRSLSAAPLLASALAFVTPPAAAQTAPAARYRAEVVSAVRRDMAPLRTCYEGARAEARAAWRRVRAVSVVVQPDGTIGPVTLSPGPGAPAVEACVRPVVQGWRLTPPAGGAPLTLTYSRAEIQRAAASLRR